MRHTIALAAVIVIAIVSTALLVWQRIATAPERPTISITRNQQSNPDLDYCSQTQPYKELKTCADVYRTYQVGESTFALDSNTTLTMDGERFRFDVGRVVIDGSATLTIRDVTITTSGVVTLVHYSWLNKVDVMVIDGKADVRQGTYSSTITTGNAVAVDTLPPYDALSPTTFNLEASSAAAFYDWALN